MNRSERQRRRQVRLTILAGVVLLVVGLVAVRHVMVSGGPADVVVQDDRRDAGLAAFAKGNDAEAIAQLGPYLQDHGNDAEAIFAAATIHERLAENDEAEILVAVALYRRLLLIEPERRDVAERLLGILVANPTGVEEEMLTLAEVIQQRDAGNLVAFKAQSLALPKVGRAAEGLAAAESYLQQNPSDLATQRRVLDLMKLTSELPATMLARTQNLRQTYPDDPSFVLLEAYARLMANDRSIALVWLEKSAQAQPPSAEFVQQQLEVTDTTGRFMAALVYLEDLHARGGEASEWAADELIRRRFENGRSREAYELVQTLDNPSVELRSLGVLAMLRLGQKSQAQAEIDHLAKQPGPRSAATAKLLRLIAEPQPEPTGVAWAGREAQALGVINPYLDMIVGEVHERLKQEESAVQRYESALRRRPSWGAPLLGLAEIMLDRGEADQAARYALAAALRMPESLSAQITLAQAMGAEPGRLNHRKAQEVMSLIDRVQQAQPGEPKTLALRVAVLAGRGQNQQAALAIKAALAMEPALSREALLELIERVRGAGLNVEPIRQAYIERFGATPQITMLRAMELADRGENDAALAAFDEAQPAEPSPQWRANRALLLERLGRPGAMEAWAEIGDALPSNRKAQQSVLRSSAAWEDRALIKRTVERLRAITGEDDPAWRVAQARWLLESDDPAGDAVEADRLLGEALELAPDSSAALVTRSRTKRLLGEFREALALLERAVALSPDHADARIELAYAQRGAGKHDAALDAVQAVSTMPNLTSAQLRRTAQLLILGEDLPAAARTLERLHRLRRATSNDLYTLAQLYQRQHRNDEALLLVDAILQVPTAASVTFVADLQARGGLQDKALTTLGMLDYLGLSKTEADTLRAAHLAVHTSAAEAERVFVELTQSDPTNATTWQNLVTLQMRTGQVAQAVASAKRGQQAAPGDAGLAAVADQQSLLEGLADEPELTGFWLALLDDAEFRPVAARALGLIEKSKRLDETTAQRGAKLTVLADEYPGFEALQMAAIAAELATSKRPQALERASAAMAKFPKSAQAARLTAQAYASAGRWREAAVAAEAWGRRQATHRQEADTLAAKSHRMLGRADQAIQTLTPYRALAQSQPTQSPAIARELALSLAQTGEDRAARRILEPVLTAGPYWRLTWMDAAVTSVSDARRAGGWLETVEPLIPASAWGERKALAEAWWALGVRVESAAYRDRGREKARALAQQPEADAGLWFFLGTISEAEGDFADAQQAYRRALSLDPQLATAENNLAMVLVRSGDLEDAVRLAESAIAKVPDEANFHDTLAFVLAAAGRYGEAEAAIRQAIELDPTHAQWQLRLNEIMMQRASAEVTSP